MLVFAALCATLSALPASALPGVWYRDARDEHPVHKLFSRQTSFPTVGSAEWTAKYPAGALTVANTPKAWLDALKAAEDAGKIPNVPIGRAGGAYTAANGTRLDPAGAFVCSSAAQCQGDGQIYNVPDGIVALSFDDGPLPASPQLYKFLREQKQTVTHFFIGSNILENPNIFLEAFNDVNDDMAVHTWSHPEMPTLSNELVLAELGWTMQIIHDSTGGRLPRYWRPSYGASDNRVRAIAREIFGLTTVIWNADTDDWNIGKATTKAAAKKILTDAYAGPKSPGLNILEHELSKDCIDIFIETYPLIKQNGWEAKSIPDALGQAWYLNAVNNASPVTERLVYGGPNGTVQAGSGGSGGSSASASSTDTAGSSNPTNPATGSNASNGALGLSAGGWSLAALVAALAMI